MKRKAAVVVVDDEQDLRENVAEYLAARGFTTHTAETGAAALEVIESERISAVVLDLVMPGMGGLDVLRQIKAIDPHIQVIMVTGKGSVQSAVEAMRAGAYDYVTKPVKLAELEPVVMRAAELTLLKRQNSAYRDVQARRGARLASEMIAQSPAMCKVLDMAGRYAMAEMPVLIEGETGTGKELIAEFIHANSGRKEAPLVVLDCGALSETLIDSELFGHEKGAFTGATDSRAGMLEVADGGTLFLDEIASIPMAVQTRLLRFLERGIFRRVGARAEKTVDARVIAASNRNLDHVMAEGKFRDDLYHRLAVLRVNIPPLRDRVEDIMPLAHAFLARLSDAGGQPMALSEDARETLLAYAWPGNVRELLHTIERAAFTARSQGAGEVQEHHLGLVLSPREDRPVATTLKGAGSRHVRTVLEQCEGNRKRAAEMLGISERHLYRLLQAELADEENPRQ
ncbi:sigma-54-dependent Fis family transcriptional regulator [bacterium]|nr:sigma-54-dependent Fis family transcriptional regulator [bacterium]